MGGLKQKSLCGFHLLSLDCSGNYDKTAIKPWKFQLMHVIAA